MRRRDRVNRPLLSEVLRHNTEQRWTDDRGLIDADGGPGCDDFCPHDDHHHGHDQGTYDDPNQDNGEEWV
jgi:hypothetical protein